MSGSAPRGRYAIVFLGATARPNDSFSLSFLDLNTGVQTPITIPAPTFSEYVSLPYNGGRIVANDGTTVLGITDFDQTLHGYLLKPGADPVPFPVQDGLPLLIDASASKVLYQQQDGLYLLDLGTIQSTRLILQIGLLRLLDE